ncbi:hypothetical protein D3C79_930930 [compost metagenome]
MCAGGSVVILHCPLHLITGITAAQRANHCRNVTTATAAELVANHATGYRTQHGTGNAVFILHGRTVSDGHIAAFLTWGFDGFFDRRGSEHLRKLRTRRKHIHAGNRGNTQSGCNTNPNTG